MSVYFPFSLDSVYVCFILPWLIKATFKHKLDDTFFHLLKICHVWFQENTKRKKKHLRTLNVVSLWFWFRTQLHKNHKGLKIPVLFVCIWQSKMFGSEPKMIRAWVSSLVAHTPQFNGTKAACSRWREEKQGGGARMCLERKERKKLWKMQAWLQGFCVTRRSRTTAEYTNCCWL